jgi:hypothetical protein
MVVCGGLALIMDGHGVILLPHSAILVLSGLHHFGLVVLINVILIIVLAVRQPVLVVIKKTLFLPEDFPRAFVLLQYLEY